METKLELSLDEMKILESVYGRQNLMGVDYNPRKLESISDLTAQEKKFFTGKNFMSSHFFIQTIYKVKGVVNPMKFTITVNRLLKDNENLRANFCNLGTRTVKVIHPVGSVRPEIIFRNLTAMEEDELDDEFRKILEAGMRLDCDLRHDLLIRFAVYKTSAEEFAVLITIAQLIADSFNSEEFFATLADLPAISEPKNFDDDLPAKNQKTIREYWAKILDNPPPPAQLPYAKNFGGEYSQKAHRTKIPADILSDLRGFAQSNRTMLTAILQSAWGFMLQVFNKRRDCLFCQILSAGKADKNFSLNVIPVRLTSENNLTVEQIVRNQFRQLVVSQPYRSFDWEDLEILTSRKKFFDHFLSFAEFQSNEINYSATPADNLGTVIYRNSWDAREMKLGVYFRYSEKNLSVTFLYDEKSFDVGGGVLLSKLYELVLNQMLVDKNAKFSAFSKNLDARIQKLYASIEISHADDKKKIREFLSQLPLLQSCPESTLELLADKSKLATRFEGDRISGDVLGENFIFVMNGKLVRSLDSGDGWYNPLDVIGANSFVNLTSFLIKRRLTFSAEILTEQAELLTIPHDLMLEVLRQNSEVAISIMNHALDQMEKYQALWLQS